MRVRVCPAGAVRGRWRQAERVTGLSALVLAFSFLPGSIGSAAAQDIVLHTGNVTTIQGNWAATDSWSAAGNRKMASADWGWSATEAPHAHPGNYFEGTFHAEAWTSYRVWLRMRATGDSKWNDSVWVQFSDSIHPDYGVPWYQIGTSSALLVNLEACYDCGVGSWGWSGGAWWVSQQLHVQFPSAGTKTIRIQTREDGVEIDQIVLSAGTYLHSAPGGSAWDNTILTGGGSTSSSTTSSSTTSSSGSSSSSSPFGGSAWPIPGTIQTEDFDHGGQGVSYYDDSAGNTPGAYRATDVDIETTPNGGHAVSWVQAGEWVRHTVNVSTSGHYTLTARVASLGSGGSFHVEFNGGDKTGAMFVPNTGSWTTYQDVTATVWLDAGVQPMRMVFDSNGWTGFVGNFSYVRLDSASTSSAQPAPAPEPAPAPQYYGGGRVRVMTWNIAFGWGNTWGQAQEIANSGADVALLQEASIWDEYMPSTYVERLQQMTGQTWRAVWAPHGGRYTDNEGTLILTRLPVVGQSTMNAYERGFSRVTVDVGGIHVHVFNTHLDWDTGMRTSQLHAFMDWMRQFSGPAIAGGDFNSWWGEYWITQMETEFSDTWKDVTGSTEGGYTLNGAVRFDYLFRAYRDNWRLSPTACWVPWTGSSDHLPVIADYSVQ